MLTEAKRPRFGLWGIGVPSSSKRSGEVRLWVEWVGDCRCKEERGGVLGGGGGGDGTCERVCELDLSNSYPISGWISLP